MTCAPALPAPPDWNGGSVLNLMTSVAHASGAPDWPNRPLAGLDGAALARARTLVLLVVDGLGAQYLREHCPRGALAGALAGTLDSLVPTTTASVITTYMTGQAPAVHGLTGWFVHDDTLGGAVCPLPATLRRGGVALDAAARDALYTTPALYGALARRCHVVQPQWLTGTAYTRHHGAGAQLHGFRTLTEMTAIVTELAHAAGPARLVYAYWPELDHLGHSRGIHSAAARAHLCEVDAAIGALAGALGTADCVLLVTADHGFVDVPPNQVLSPADAPGVQAALRAPLSGEPRLAYAHVHADLVAEFPGRVARAWGERVTVWPAAALLAGGHFGPGAAHPRLAARCGDFVLVPAPGYMLRERLPGEREFPLIGVHGGLTRAERDVPLAVFGAA